MSTYAYPPAVGTPANPVRAKRAHWVAADMIDIGDLVDMGDGFLAMVTNLRPFDTAEFGSGIRIMTTIRGYLRAPTERVKRWVEA
jgi:hypothetical protein